MAGPEAGNRVLLIAALATCGLLIVLIAALSPPPPTPDAHGRPSSFFSDPSGSMASFLVLERLLGRVERWLHPPGLLAFQTEPEEQISTYVLMGPRRALRFSDAQALEDWVSRGGQLILAVDRPWPVTGTARDDPAGEEALGEAEAGVPREEGEGSPESESGRGDFSSRHGFRVVPGGLQPAAGLWVAGTLAEGDFEVLERSAAGIAVGRKQLGDGELLVIPDSRVFSNGRLRDHPANMSWLAHRVAAAGPGRIVFDEYHHGFASPRGLLSLLASFLPTPWGAVCVQLSLAGLVYLLGVRRRFGPRLDLPPRQLRSPTALVRARAGLLKTARARRLSIELFERYRQRRQWRAPGRPASVLEEQTSQYRDLLREATRAARLDDAAVLRLGRLSGELTRSTQ